MLQQDIVSQLRILYDEFETAGWGFRLL